MTKSRKITWLVIGAAVLIIIGLCIWIFRAGANDPTDFGVVATQEDYLAACAKLNFTPDEAPQTGVAEDYAAQFGPTGRVQTSLTGLDLTALFSVNRPAFEPVTDVQVRMVPPSGNKRPTFELLCTADYDWVMEVFLNDFYTQEEVEFVLGAATEQVKLYVEVSGGVEDNRSDFKIERVNINGLHLPRFLTGAGEAKEIVNGVTDVYLQQLQQSTGAYFNSVTVQDGELKLDAMVPERMEWAAK